MPSMIRRLAILCTLGLLAGPAAAAAPPRPTSLPPSRALHVIPASVTLVGAEAEQALLVTVTDALGLERDATGEARYASSSPKVARVTPEGLVRIAGDGYAEVRVEAGGRTARVRVTSRNAATPRPLNFTNEILPVLSKA